MNIDVSIVIVCMNNLKNLYPCLESIKKYTMVSYETLVVAYLFSKESLEKVKNDFPWVTFIESNEIRGFSGNNNLALRQAKGKYCFVLNDDTEMKMDVVGGLVKTIESLPENVAIVSPKLLYPNGEIQVCGRPPFGIKQYIKRGFNIWNEKRNGGKYSNQTGVFETYNIIGAAFLIKNEIFKEYDFFDERYFFCPEDIALSTSLNKTGFKCYVDSNLEIIHYEGGSGIQNVSKLKMATNPAGEKGTIIFLSDGNVLINNILSCFSALLSLLRAIKYKAKSKKHMDDNYILFKANLNTCFAVFSSKTPKEIFQKYYLLNINS